MKTTTKILLLALTLSSAVSFGQCYNQKRNYDNESHFGIVVNIGTLKSLGGEVYVKLNNHIIGGGYAGGINQYDDKEFKNETLYLTYGYKVNKLTFGGRYGKQNKANWLPTKNNPNTSEKVVTPYSEMIGGYVGYNLSDKVAINLGYDTFSNITIGFAFGL